MILFRRSFASGALNCRSGVYFMEGASFVFARFASSQESMVALRPYFGSVQKLHSHKENTRCILRSKSNPNWKEKFGYGGFVQLEHHCAVSDFYTRLR